MAALCPNLRVKTGIMVNYKDIHCSCNQEKIAPQYMSAVCKGDYKKCSLYKQYGIVNGK